MFEQTPYCRYHVSEVELRVNFQEGQIQTSNINKRLILYIFFSSIDVV